ncbi:uncharacterized protein FRV6_02769 [Fusarium oxysporum]|uniref:Uncharacterized protein n=1 Tax=Fusarium oxysporum TaxID=5507 RepID=A0A2H3SQ01_FUSOX|nr:uncharacterized protein FRV6_02769 [Fusarium oxysporum]
MHYTIIIPIRRSL